MADAAFEAEIQKYVGKPVGPPEVARDRVNEPMVRHWCEAMGDDNAAYTAAGKDTVHGGIVAPPMMLQAWILKGYEMSRETEPQDLHEALHVRFDAEGYTGVVATNCTQGYTRYLVPGDEVKAVMTIESISEQKATALGLGYFIETRTSFLDQNDAEVGWMTFRVLKFKPGEAQQQAAAASPSDAPPAKPGRIRPPMGQDVAWWWDGIDAGHLLIQRCKDCGKLRHPPRPICDACQSMEWDHIASAGQGTVHSYVVMHHPPIPGYELPLAIGLIDLEEGTRVVANVEGLEPDDVQIGMSVECSIEEMHDGFNLPIFRPAK